MGKLTTGDNGTNRQFKLQIYQSKRSRQHRKFYDTHNYNRGNCQNRYRSNSRDRRIQFSGQSRGRLGYEQNYRNEYRRGNFRYNLRMYQNFGRQNKGGYRGNYRSKNYNRERGRSRSRERSFSGNINNRRNNRSISNSRSRSVLRVSINRDRNRCYNCGEYDHFMKDCPTSKVEREIEQMQQIFNLDEGQTSFKTLATGMYDSLDKNKFFRRYNTTTRPLKCIEGRNDPTTFLPLSTNVGRQIRLNKHKYKENKYLTQDQARHIYKKVESGNIIDINTLKQEKEQDS